MLLKFGFSFTLEIDPIGGSDSNAKPTEVAESEALDPDAPFSSGTYKFYSNKHPSLALNPDLPARKHGPIGIERRESSVPADH